jgi:hypothetical protein
MFQMFLALSFFRVDFLDFIVRIMGSEILRTIASSLIRTALTRIGL